MQPDDDVEDVRDEDAELEEQARLEAEMGSEDVARSMNMWACSMVDMTMSEALLDAVSPLSNADHGPDMLSFREGLEEPEGLEQEPDIAAEQVAAEPGSVRERPSECEGELGIAVDETVRSPRSEADSLPWILEANSLEDSHLDDSLEEDLERDYGEPRAMQWSRDELENAESKDQMSSVLHERSILDDEDDISYPRRPSGSEGRPQTRGLRNAMLSQPAVAPNFIPASRGHQHSSSNAAPKSKSGRRIVYVDHHHVHHHHHFHDPRDWNGTPGDLPPEPVQRQEERNVEAKVENRMAGSGTVRSARGKQASECSSAGDCKLPTPAKSAPRDRHNNVRARSRRTSRHKGGRAAIDMGAGKSISDSVEASMLSTFSTTANSWMASASSADDSWTSGVSKQLSLTLPSAKKPNSDMPLQDYFKLMARLPMDCRLKLSPYGVSMTER
eukprot:TRINITY_DN105643_c0_g1_i1.p1 TRINITY_DN105643_c0_g1~~TRINITY_DN105643_c0_g1_i1.p1  ORF type:complete len:444 (-),score=83.42 TRINITY_DN105643_c0_g1_i1:452-1783(-)